MLISVGLVVMMTALFRTVGHASLALGGSTQEWRFQELLRDQLRHGFTLPGAKNGSLAGETTRLVFLTWKSRVNGFDGKPVVAEYSYDPQARSLSYREAALPSWWEDVSTMSEPHQLAALLEGMSAKQLVGGVEAASFAFLSPETSALDKTRGLDRWFEARLPGLVVLSFTRSQHETRLWLEPRATHG